LRQLIGRSADALVFYDLATRDAYAADGFKPEKLFVAINCLDHSEIEVARKNWLAAPERLREFRQKSGLGAGPVVLFVSRLLPANRVDLLVEATGRLSKRIPGLKTVIVGNGDREKARLKALAESVRATDNVVFVDGIYDELKLAPWFLVADVFCYPANIGLSLIHAFWYGLPVVTSDRLSVQNPEIVALNPGVNGLCYEHGNVASLAGALESMIVDRELRRAMSQAARQTVEKRFTIPQMVDGLEAAVRFAYQSTRDI
jgi:glycosyltransferase involved in cell wall biosynthesis